MKHATLPLLAAILVSPTVQAQFGGMMNPAMMMNPMTMGMMNPTMMMNPMTMGMMSPSMIAPMSGISGMNPVHYMSNPYLNPTSSLMPFLGTAVPFGNPYLTSPPKPQQATGFFPFMPAQATPAPQGYRAPQAGFGAMTSPATSARAAAPAFGYGMSAPATPPSTSQGAFMPYFPVTPAAVPQTPAPQSAQARKEVPAANTFDAAAWSRMFPNSVPPSPKQQAPAQATVTDPAQPTVTPGAPNYFDPNMWMQWMAPAATPK
jgi:hypothetical protein